MSTDDRIRLQRWADVMLCVHQMQGSHLLASVVAGLVCVSAADGVRPDAITSVEHASAGPPTASEIEEARRAAHYVGSLIWAAQSPDELDEILDATLDDEEAWRLAGVVTSSAARGCFPQTSDAGHFISSIHGKLSDQRIVQGLLNAGYIASRLGRVMEKLRAPIEDYSEATATMASEVLRGILDSKKYVFCAVALIDFIVSDQRPRSDVILAAVDWWVRGSLSYLRVLAMIADDNEALMGIIPPHEWLNKDDVIKRYDARERAFDAFMASDSG